MMLLMMPKDLLNPQEMWAVVEKKLEALALVTCSPRLYLSKPTSNF